MKSLSVIYLLILIHLFCSTSQASSSSSYSDMSKVSSVIRTTPVKQPNALEFAESLLVKQVITRKEQDKAIALLEEKKPLADIEEMRRWILSYTEDLKELEAQEIQSALDERACETMLRSAIGIRDSSMDVYEKVQQENKHQANENGVHPDSRISTILHIIATAQEMLAEGVPESHSDDDKGKKIQELLYQLTVSGHLSKKTVSVDSLDHDDDDDYFDEHSGIEKLADARFEKARMVEQDRLASIIAKFQQICKVIEAIAPLAVTIEKEAGHHKRRAESVRSEIVSAQNRLEELRQELKHFEDLIARLKVKIVT